MTITPWEKAAFWLRIEDWQHRACVISLIGDMKDEGYTDKSIRNAIQVISAFVTWKNDHCGEEPRQLCSNDVDRFLIDRAAAGELCHGNRRALRRLEMHLLEAGALSRPPEPHDPIGDVVAQYATHLRRRGYADQSIASHIWFGRRFLRTMWNERSGTSWLTHDDLRNYLTNQFEDLSSATAKVMCSRLRGLLRFLASADLANSDLDLAIPRVRNLRHASLPSFMTPSQLDQVLAACNRSTTAGRRDYAILLLLARLGLRAGEAALIALDDIDWRAGLLRVKGKGGQIASIPLPHDVGEAISDYILRGRPLSGSRTIFHRVETPYTPFRSASMVSLIAGRALRRAGITGLRSRYAHVFRHTFATIAIRSGASLTELGQVLGHKDPNTTRIYAKVDIEGLRSLSRAWMGAAL